MATSFFVNKIYSILTSNPAVLACCVLTAALTYVIYRHFRLDIPGPLPVPLVGNWLLLDKKRPFVTLDTWRRRYGGLYRISVPGRDRHRLVVSGFDEIHEVLVSRGGDFSGRPDYRRLSGTHHDISRHRDADEKWRALRKLCHWHLRRHVDGSDPRLETGLRVIMEDMFERFAAFADTALDPYDVIRHASVRSILFLLTGRELPKRDPLYRKIKEFLLLTETRSSVTWRNAFINWLPWLRRFSIDESKNIHRSEVLSREIWEDIKEHSSLQSYQESLGRLLNDAANFPARTKSVANISLSDLEARSVALNLLTVGVPTTALTFYASVNILAAYPDLQANIQREIESYRACQDLQGPITPQDQAHLPYTRATILELLRFTSTMPFGMTHRAVTATQIQSRVVPQDSQILANLWGVHHDPAIWRDPHAFRPDRFLDESGRRLVPADDPARRHLLAFGAGPRVCLGEQLAPCRLFVWLSNLCDKFVVSPGDPTDRTDPDPRGFVMEGELARHPPYTVRLTPRNTGSQPPD